MAVHVGEIYEHYRNKKQYRIVALARDTETLGLCVVYQGLYDDPEFGNNPIWIRSLDLFEGYVDIDGHKMSRFTLLSS